MLNDDAYDRATMPNTGNTLNNYFKPVPKVERPAVNMQQWEVVDELQAEIERALDEDLAAQRALNDQRALDGQTERDLEESMAWWAH